MNKQLKESFQDVIPTYQEKIPSEVISCADSLYKLSLQLKPNLPNNSEIARHRICAYLAVEKYLNQLDLPEPISTKIPVQPKVLNKLMDDFRENVLNQIRSANSTPRSSPTKSMKTPPKTRLSPLKNNATNPRVSSPLKRLQELQDEVPKRRKYDKTSGQSNSPFKDMESPFNPKKVLESQKTPTIYKYDRKHVSISDFISFANNFFIPSTITPKMVETLVIHKHKFVKKSEWLLACGVINAAYVRINHRLLKTKMGAKSQFNEQLFHYQKGGLMKWNIQLWCDIVDDWIKDEPWVLEMEKKYMYQSKSLEDLKVQQEIDARIGTSWELLEKFGAMIHGDTLYDSESQVVYQETWVKNALLELEK